MVSTPQNMRFIVLLVKHGLILLAQDRLKEINVWLDQKLDQICRVKVMVELLGVILVAPSLDSGDDEALVHLV